MRKSNSVVLRLDSTSGSLRMFDGRYLTDGKMAIDRDYCNGNIDIGPQLREMWRTGTTFNFHGTNALDADQPFPRSTVEECFSREKGNRIVITRFGMEDGKGNYLRLAYDVVTGKVIGIGARYLDLVLSGTDCYLGDSGIIGVFHGDNKIAVVMHATIHDEALGALRSMLMGAPTSEEQAIQ